MSDIPPEFQGIVRRCASCWHWGRPPNARKGNDRVYRCEWPEPLLVLPSSITRGAERVLPVKQFMAADDGSDCPVWEPMWKPALIRPVPACDHEWLEKKDSQSNSDIQTAVECSKCHVPGALDLRTGEVFWPAT